MEYKGFCIIISIIKLQSYTKFLKYTPTFSYDTFFLIKKYPKNQADGKCSRTRPLPPTQAVRELENEVFLFVSLYEAEVKYAILVEE